MSRTLLPAAAHVRRAVGLVVVVLSAAMLGLVGLSPANATTHHRAPAPGVHGVTINGAAGSASTTERRHRGYYGAIAFNPANGYWVRGWAYRTRKAAVRATLNYCRRHSGRAATCRRAGSVHHGFAAVRARWNGHWYLWTHATGRTRTKAFARAYHHLHPSRQVISVSARHR